MRKYSISKIAYIVLIAMLACLSIGYTYAYFSAQVSAESAVKLGRIDIVWRDKNTRAYITETMFPDDNGTTKNESLTIPVVDPLKRGECTAIATNKGNLKLEVYNRNNEDLTIVSAYCRIQIQASYIPAGGKEADRVYCKDENGWFQWFQLASKTGTDENGKNTYSLITEKDINSWFYKDGYYYLGTKEYDYDLEKDVYSFVEITPGGGIEVADYIYMSPDADAEMLGATVNIVVKLEAIQANNKAYESMWGFE